MSWNWRDFMRLSIAASLLAAAVWANVSGSPLQQVRGAWTVYAMR
jgi:hypothetical protein